jgi:glyoxylase-like metal-dependent hydrolase (beta-lactamase superfamily II)
VRWRQVVPGLWRMWFPAIDNNAYLIAGPEATLVDCGPPATPPKVLASFPEGGMDASDIRHVALTHCHTDHTGQLAAVVAATGASVYAHPIDAQIVRTGAERPRGKAHGMVGRIMLAMARKPSRADPAPVSVELRDGQDLPAGGGMRCLFTPGHTGGHVSFLWPDHGVLFVGDAAANMFRCFGLAPLNEDDATARASFRRLAEQDFEVACFGHGPPIVGRAVERFRRKLARL